MPSDLTARSIDKQGGRHAWGAELECRARRRIDVEAQRLDSDLAEELAHRFRALLVDGKRDHLEIGPTEPRLKAIQRRHFLPAGRAPGRPDVEQHEASLELGKRARPARTVQELHIGQRFGPGLAGERHSGGGRFGFAHRKIEPRRARRNRRERR